MKKVCIHQIEHERGLVGLGKSKSKLGVGYAQEKLQFHQERESIKNAHFSWRGEGAMAAHTRGYGAWRGGPSGENSKGRGGLEPHEERMSVCVCVCVCVCV